jgi:V/A-type H+-transporting ATPase subunit A
MAAVIEEGFLRQSAYDPKDASCSPARQAMLLHLLLRFYTQALAAVDRGVPVPVLLALPIVPALARAKTTFGDEEVAALEQIGAQIDEACATAAAGEEARP